MLKRADLIFLLGYIEKLAQGDSPGYYCNFLKNILLRKTKHKQWNKKQGGVRSGMCAVLSVVLDVVCYGWDDLCKKSIIKK